MDVEVKGQKSKKAKVEDNVIVRAEEVSEEKKLSKVEAKRSKPTAFGISQIKKMTKEQKATAIEFMKQRNEARVKASMEPAYTKADMDLYK